MPVCLSVQSLVVAGAVGQGAAAFALSAEGIEVWPLPTVVLSGHAATPGVQGRRLPGGEIAALTEGLAASGQLARVDAILTGYLGTPEAGAAVAELVAAVRAVRPDALYLCDPVLGDAGRLYLPEAMVALYRERLVPMSDIITPNMDELGWLAGAAVPVDAAEAAALAARLRARGPGRVFVTSVPEGAERIGILSQWDDGETLATAPRVPLHLHGAGDFVAALVLSETLRGVAPDRAARRAVDAVAALAAEALAEGRSDLPVTRARALWARPGGA